MLSFEEFRSNIGKNVKKSIIKKRLDNNLIPGTIYDGVLEKAFFLESARRPYQNRWLKPGMRSDNIRYHIVRASILRRHVFHLTFYLSEEEFGIYARQLVEAGFIELNMRDGIVYYDSTPIAERYNNKGAKALKKSLDETLSKIAQGVTQGFIESHM